MKRGLMAEELTYCYRGLMEGCLVEVYLMDVCLMERHLMEGRLKRLMAS